MQPLPNADDLPTLLSRFHTWAEKQPSGSGNGNGHRNGASPDGVRELTYEEALEHHRERPASPRRTTSGRSRAAAGPEVPKAALPAPNAIPPAALVEEPIPPVSNALAAGEGPTGSSAIIPPAPPDVALMQEPQPSRERPPKKETATEAAVPKSLSAPRPEQRPSAKKAAAKKSAAPPPQAKVPPPPKAATPAPAHKAGPAGSATAGKRSSPPHTRTKAQNEFRHVLAKTVRAAKKPAAASKPKLPDRTRRFTTRFSATEERRIEKSAAAAGMTVSAYLRKCALAAEPSPATQPQKSRTAKKAQADSTASEQTETRLFLQPASPSLFGGWLSLLRQRFLSSPARFSERA